MVSQGGTLVLTGEVLAEIMLQYYHESPQAMLKSPPTLPPLRLQGLPHQKTCPLIRM